MTIAHWVLFAFRTFKLFRPVQNSHKMVVRVFLFKTIKKKISPGLKSTGDVGEMGKNKTGTIFPLYTVSKLC